MSEQGWGHRMCVSFRRPRYQNRGTSLASLVRAEEPGGGRDKKDVKHQSNLDLTFIDIEPSGFKHCQLWIQNSTHADKFYGANHI